MPQRTNPVSRDRLERLSAAVSRNPGDAAFIELGEAYLSLGRPREAVDVGARGLRADPNSMDGRVMVGRAFCAMHKWKQAQAELLKVVKTDKHHQQAFRLLGEVLMRRGDYDRALPVLQHAQNLAPADPDVLALLKRARAGQPLDPPPPVPQPREPQGSAPPSFDDAPTRLADEDGGGVGRGALGRVELDRREVRGDYRAPQEAGVRRADDRGRDLEDHRPVALHQPPPPEDPFAPVSSGRARLPPDSHGGGAASGGKPGGRPAPGPPEGVRPRVFSGEKPRGEGEAALRQSAAVGEDYLNNLLTNGLLDVPNVRARDVKQKVPSGAAWGRSSRGMFIGLFTMLLLLTVAGAGWYFYDERQAATDVARHVELAQAAIGPGTYQGLAEAVEEVKRAIERDKENPYPIAVYAQVASIHHLLYGAGSVEEIRSPVGAISKEIQDGDPGHYEVRVATTALTLADLAGREVPEVALRQLRGQIAADLEAYPDDDVLHWLAGLAALRAGERTAAAAAFEKAEGLAAARIARADLLLDDGEPAAAFDVYNEILDDVPEHPWAFIGRSLSRSLRNIEPDDAIADLNVGLAKGAGPRIDAWKQLANAYALMAIEDFAGARESLAAAAGPDEPRFLARKALAHLELGQYKEGTDARAAVEWYGPEAKRDPDPLVTVIDAELYLARGLPNAALAKLEGVAGVRAHRARGLALLDLGKPGDAKEAFDAGLAIAPDDLQLQAWREAALFIDSRSDRDRAGDALARLGRQSNSKVPPFIHGLALLRGERERAARGKLEQSVEPDADEGDDGEGGSPNRYAYRAHALLAEIALADDKVSVAGKHVEAALAQNPGFLPAKGLAGRVFLAAGDPAAALEQLGDVVANDAASAAEELAWAEAVIRVAGDGLSSEDKDAAKQALERAATKGASDDEVERVTSLLDGDGGVDDDDSDRDDRRERKRRSSRRRRR